jgi:hypothetical protein
MGKVATSMTVKPLTAADLASARTSWQALLDRVCDSQSQANAVAVWASIWAEPLMRAAAIGLQMTRERERQRLP